MLARRKIFLTSETCKRYITTRAIRPVPILTKATVEAFREEAFIPATPALLPSNTFQTIPATHKWFSKDHHELSSLNRSYLSRYGSTIVPLEISNDDHFSRTEQSLSFFLECVHASSSNFDARPNRYFSAYVPGARAVKKTTSSNTFFSASALTAPTARVYLAQASIANLPQGLRDDVSTPELVLKAGKGDIYDSSIWLGQAPTYTPLHRDPNPNLFVQLAGRKVVRIFPPDTGRALFAKVQEKIGGFASENMRGEEMMKGMEKKALEHEVWGDEGGGDPKATMWQAELGSGDGLFIPKGWWHSVRSIGNGMIGSVNWWFR